MTQGLLLGSTVLPPPAFVFDFANNSYWTQADGGLPLGRAVSLSRAGATFTDLLPSSPAVPSPWETAKTYSASQQAIGSDGYVYTSVSGSNTSNNPTLAPGFWTKGVYGFQTFAANTLRVTPGKGFRYETARTNLLFPSLSTTGFPITTTPQTTGSLATGIYCLWVNGTGSAKVTAGTATINNFISPAVATYSPPAGLQPLDLPGSGNFTAVQGTPIYFNVAIAGTVTVTVTGALTAYQLEKGNYGTSLIVTTTATLARPGESTATILNLYAKGIGTAASATLYCETYDVTNTYGGGSVPWLLSTTSDVLMRFVGASNLPNNQAIESTFLATNIFQGFAPNVASAYGNGPTVIRCALGWDGNGRSMCVNNAGIVTDSALKTIETCTVGGAITSGDNTSNVTFTSSALTGSPISISVPVGETLTIGGTVVNGDNASNITFTSSALAGSPIAISASIVGGDTTTTVAAKYVTAINANATLSGAGIVATSVGPLVTIVQPAALSPQVTYTKTNGTNITLTLAVDSTTTAATKYVAAINANSVLAAAGVTALASGALFAIYQPTAPKTPISPTVTFGSTNGSSITLTLSASDANFYLSGTNATRVPDGYIRCVKGWSSRLTDAQIQLLTQQVTTPVDSATDNGIAIASGTTLPMMTISTHQRQGVSALPIGNSTNVGCAQAVGAKMVRIDATWSAIERSVGNGGLGNGVYDWTASSSAAISAGDFDLDATVHAFYNAGIQVQLVCGYGNPVAGSPAYTTGFFTLPTTAGGIAGYANFCAAVASHYDAACQAAGLGHPWLELWNESDLAYSTGTPNATTFANAIGPAAPAIKAVVPGATVVVGGLANNPAINTYIGTVISVLTAAGNLPSFDGVGWHPYNTGFCPESIFNLTQSFATATGVTPLYSTEFGVSPNASQELMFPYFLPDPRALTLQAYFAVRSLLVQMMSGLKQICWYDLVNDGIDILNGQANYGLFDSFFNVKPAATAMANVTRAFVLATSWSYVYYPKGDLYVATFHYTGGTNTIIWSPSCSVSYTYRSPGFSTIVFKDVFNNIVSVSNPSTGVYAVPVSGGAPVIIYGAGSGSL